MCGKRSHTQKRSSNPPSPVSDKDGRQAAKSPAHLLQPAEDTLRDLRLRIVQLSEACMKGGACFALLRLVHALGIISLHGKPALLRVSVCSLAARYCSVKRRVRSTASILALQAGSSWLGGCVPLLLRL